MSGGLPAGGAQNPSGSGADRRASFRDGDDRHCGRVAVRASGGLNQADRDSVWRRDHFKAKRVNDIVGVDSEGFIATVPIRPVQPEFTALVEDVCSTLTHGLGPRVHSIYLYGSVANGHALPGISDLDITLVLLDTDVQVSERLAAIKADLQERHPEVTKIDFDTGHRDEVLAESNRFSWGYWLKHHCRCIWGDDLGTRFERFKPSRKIALAVNGDFETVLKRYLDTLAKETCPAQIRRLQREAARKLVRATNILRAEYEPGWPLTLEDHAEQFIRRAPHMQAQIGFFMAQARQPDATVASFAAKMQQFVDWMLAQTAPTSGSR